MRPESREELLKRIQELERRLAESEETLDALRSGEVDAIVASGPDGDQIYTLKGADEAYRQIVEDMTEGALTLARDGLILFSNERLARLVATRLEQVIGSYLQDLMSWRRLARRRCGRERQRCGSNRRARPLFRRMCPGSA